ncbi:hypothetical protein [Nisaea sp.]|uniref:hypothetical protein n=1 Tax=Nisaea sp. TaxID=2024842 RepID=UPI00326610C5
MSVQVIEEFRPRAVLNLGLWEVGPLQIKVYGLLAEGREIAEDLLSKAEAFLIKDVLPRVAAEGEDNGLGFVILHPGDLGVSISAHWWIQGSVLCQHNYRKLYDANEPMNTVERPAVACVWELAIINAEQEAWRETMMTRAPDQKAYLERRAGL